MEGERELCERRILAVADALRDVTDRLVFIGGTVLPLLVDVDRRFYAPRMTDDVDAVGVAASYGESRRVEAAVAAAGFRPNLSSRHKGQWIGPDGSVFDLSFAGDFSGASGSSIDLMAIETAVSMQRHTYVRHLSPTGLFLMKCAAYGDRGRERPEDSKDLADIAVLLVGSRLEDDVAQWPGTVRDEVATSARWLAAETSATRALLSHFADRRPRPPETVEELADEALALLSRLAR